MTTHTITLHCKISEVYEILKRAQSGDTLIIPADDRADLVRRSLKRLYPDKRLTIKTGGSHAQNLQTG